MTMPRLAAMREYWKQSPPMHELLAAYVGYKPQEDEPVKDIADLIAMMGG